MATITRLPSGKYRAQVRKKGVYKARTFDRKADANAWSVDIERAIAGGSTSDTIAAPKDMTLGDVITAYLEQVNVGRTVRVNLIRVKDRIGNTALASLNAVVLREYVESRKADGVTGSTLAADLSNFSSVLKWARHVKNLDINTSLAKDARQSLSAERIDTRSAERTRVPTEAEIAALCEHFENNPRQHIPMATITRFAAASAMRLGEICRIRIEDIKWNERAVLIRERKDPKRKARNDQEVPLVGKAYEIARQQAEGRTEGRLFPYDAKSASTAFTRAVAKLGIEDLRFHDLRHLGITELFRAGLSTPLVAVVSGHRDWRHLKRYTNLNAQDVHAALEGKL